MLTPKPPRLAITILESFLRDDFAEDVNGDLEEKFFNDLKTKSAFRSKLNFWYQVFRYIRPFAFKKSKRTYNQYDMFKSYFKIGWRNLLVNKGYSFINIFGLAVGMATCVLIMLYVTDEMSYDKHHEHGDRIYRIASAVEGERFVGASAPIAAGLKKDFPEVEQSTRLLRFPGADKMLLKDEQGDKQFFEINGFYVDSTFFELFSYDLKYGDMGTALDGPNSIVISEQVAFKIFGNENPVDKPLKVGLSFGDFNYTVKGVFRENGKSHIPANLLLSMDNDDVGGWVETQNNWATNNIFHTYVKLVDGTDSKGFENKLQEFLDRNGGENLKAAGFHKSLFIQPLEDIYLHSNYGFEVAPNGNMKYLYIFTSIAFFLLLIACINFMNLSTARSDRRAKEVGLRKVVGAFRKSLVSQFLMESMMMSLLALLLAILFIQLSLPFFNQVIGKELSLNQLPHVYELLLGLAIGTGIFAGLYPAFYLSSFKPASVLKGKLINTFSAVSIRKSLVVFQFTVSIVLILGAVVISNQMHFLSSNDLGFNKNQQIVLPLQTREANENAEVLKNQIMENAQVASATRASSYPGIENIQDMLFYAEGKTNDESKDVIMNSAGADYIATLGITLLQGRDFAREIKYDSSAIILNETAVMALGYDFSDVIGRNVYYEWNGDKFSMQIIGVVKDYHYKSLHEEIKPMALTVSPLFVMPTSYLIMNIKTADYAGLITWLGNEWKKVNTTSPFTYSFLDDDFQRNYEKEERTLSLIRYFTSIAVVIACLGLLGLASFTAGQRVKEIGVRKILGASVLQVVMLLSKDFMVLVAIAIAIASPVGYYLINQWLQGFAYHIDINLSVFVIAGLSAVAIAFITISIQTLKAAISNPVDSLRSE